MPFHVLVVYPNDGEDFNMDYYLKTHMPLVKDTWKSYGLTGWKVNKFADGPDGSKPDFKVGATLIWGSGEDAKKAMTSESAGPIFGDIPNFTKTQPKVLAGELVGED